MFAATIADNGRKYQRPGIRLSSPRPFGVFLSDKGASPPRIAVLGGLHQTKLRENAVARNQFSANSDNEPEHGQTTIPGFSKVSKAKFVVLSVHCR